MVHTDSGLFFDLGILQRYWSDFNDFTGFNSGKPDNFKWNFACKVHIFIRDSEWL